MRTLSYPETGATRTGDRPRGYHHLRYRRLLAPAGHGDPHALAAAAGEAIVTWRMHRAAGARVEASARRAAPGAIVTVGLGFGPVRIAAPCQVIWTTGGTGEREGRFGFGYGTLAGHPECGEESFTAEVDREGNVWFVVRAFSRPGRWYTRLAGPVVPVFQRLYAIHLGRTLARLCAR
ncbi:MAG: hypothetical protein QOJ50_1517 [Cryptosporangiaceae bacterium]|nr:hypothetical protein [Cryptosporangiaceae bacterium]